ncbi:MAG TPA: tetratricopeptide repeat protein [Saprospiraceae bacterium]|nr:tetratricopeptide repeat protein [Saprospiraceae bacterium]
MRSLRPLLEGQKLDQAQVALQRAEDIIQQSFGSEHPSFATCLAYRGKIAQRKEAYSEAVRWYKEAMVLQEKHFGRNSPQFVISLSTLSTIYLAMGDYFQAEPLIVETLSIREKLVGKKHPDYGRTLGTYGSYFFQKGNFGKAEELYQQALDILGPTLGKAHPEYGFVLSNLTSIHMENGNYEKAEAVMQSVWEINQRVYGGKHPFSLKAMNNLATLYQQTNNISKARELYEKLVASFSDDSEKLSEDYTRALGNLANVYMMQGELAKAESLVMEAKETNEKLFGQRHREYAWAIDNLGVFFTSKKAFSKAEQLLQEALSIQETELEADHPDIILSHFHLGLLYMQMGDTKKAAYHYVQSEKLYRSRAVKITGYASNAELEKFMVKFREQSGYYMSFMQDHVESGIQAEIYNNILFHKGFLLNVGFQIRNKAAQDTASALILSRITQVQQQLSYQYTLPIGVRMTDKIAAWEEEEKILQKALAKRLIGYEATLKQVTWQDVQAALKPGEVAIEFIHYPYHKANDSKTDSICYAAVVIRKDSPAPVFRFLFEENSLLQVLKGASGNNYRKINQCYTQPELLYPLIWKPLESDLKGVTKVYGSPSGWLHRVNMGAIATANQKTVSDKFQWVNLGSTRTLALEKPARNVPKTAKLVGGVQYSLHNAEPAPTLDAAASDSLSRSDRWHFLPSTLQEVLTVKKVLETKNYQISLDTGFQATEELIKAISANKQDKSPGILHFATHGFFFPNAVSTGHDEKLVFKQAHHPFLRSGLILAGAQHIWDTGIPPANREDGVLTSQEISLLNLSQTQLVVLSACETGLGDISDYEGVFGLQRAFKIAGAQYIIMSLWKVNDQSTAAFMGQFYHFWIEKGLEPPRAFQEAQLALRTKYPNDPYHWAGFILVE